MTEQGISAEKGFQATAVCSDLLLVIEITPYAGFLFVNCIGGNRILIVRMSITGGKHSDKKNQKSG